MKFLDVKLIIAHMGRVYTEEIVDNAFELLDKNPEILYDFSISCCEYAITEVIKHAGVKKVMFGSDMPILRMRTHRIEENGTYINLVGMVIPARIPICVRLVKKRQRRLPSLCTRNCWHLSVLQKS